jgi:hypothetical protein
MPRKLRLSKEKQERAQTKERKEKLKTSDAVGARSAEDIVQKIARLRDRDDGCISCHVG